MAAFGFFLQKAAATVAIVAAVTIGPFAQLVQRLLSARVIPALPARFHMVRWQSRSS